MSTFAILLDFCMQKFRFSSLSLLSSCGYVSLPASCIVGGKGYRKKERDRGKNDTVRQEHVQRDVTHSFSQALKCFHTFAQTCAHCRARHTHRRWREAGRKGKIKNRGSLKRSGPAGCRLPEAGRQSPRGPGSERQCGLPASRWPRAL